jgi:hypothetical protein
MTAKLAANAEEILSGNGETKLMVLDRDLFVDGTYPAFARVFKEHPSHATEDPAQCRGNRHTVQFRQNDGHNLRHRPNPAGAGAGVRSRRGRAVKLEAAGLIVPPV